VQLTSEISGWKELSFSLPKTVNGQRNFRWDYIRSGYLVRLMREDTADWFLMESPKRSHKGMLVSATVTCDHVCSL